ncbi:hypothetical protein C817_05433 [Dorea sp. 5-2]|jgi:multiple sugar transport system permease protein|nr:hypothetical protein C817_05433 [Dorea sp. 5-2]MCI9025644.1 sugar ABC transporter permease [Dorea sp.]MDE6828764.1 sugar ABC transporter permease [Lachnospiraceae bacterium]
MNKEKIKRLVTLESENSWKLLFYPGRWILFLLTMVPTIYAFWLSIQNYNLAKPTQRSFVLLRNYLNVVTDSRFLGALGTTAKFTVCSLIVELVLGMLIAHGLAKRIYGKEIVQIIIMLPMIMTPVVVGLIWKMFYDAEFGVISYYISAVTGKAPNILGESTSSLLGLIVVDVWEWTPYVALILLAAIQSLPMEPYEAVKVDGASAVQTFRYLTLPLLQPAIAVAVMFRFMDLFKWMDTIYIMTGGGPGTSTETLSYYAYMNNFKFLEVGYAAAMCIVMLLIVLFICNTIGKRLLLKEES